MESCRTALLLNCQFFWNILSHLSSMTLYKIDHRLNHSIYFLQLLIQSVSQAHLNGCDFVLKSPQPALQRHSQILELFSMKVKATGVCQTWQAPYWPQLSYYLSIQTRTKAYFMKGKGLLLSKLPRATAMGPLSRRGKPKWMDHQAGALPQSISTPRGESGSICPYVGCVASHTEVSLQEARMFLRDEVKKALSNHTTHTSKGHKVKGLGLIGPFQAKNRF